MESLPPGMKYTRHLDAEKYPNGAVLDTLVEEWRMPPAGGELEVLPCEWCQGRVCLLFKDNLCERKLVQLIWTVDETLFLIPSLVGVLKEVGSRFLREILEAEKQPAALTAPRNARNLKSASPAARNPETPEMIYRDSTTLAKDAPHLADGNSSE